MLAWSAFVRWLAGIHPVVGDTLFTVSLIALTWVAGNYHNPATGRGFDGLAYLLSAMVLAPFAARRTMTMTALVVSTLSYIVYLRAGYHLDLVWWGPVIGLYSVIAHRPRWMAAIGTVLVSGVVISSGLVAGLVPPTVLLGQTALILIATWLIGNGARALAQRGIQLARLTEQLRREQDDRERHAVAEEQLRIARELHDIVAHHMSVITVQAGLARYVFDSDRATARAALDTITDAGHEAQDEMRRLLRVLRTHTAGGEIPGEIPGMMQLDELVDRFRSAGLPVEVTVTGPERPLAVPVDLCLYRVVQESLTNVLKHAGPANATVTVCYGDGEVTVIVADDGRGPTGGQTRIYG